MYNSYRSYDYIYCDVIKDGNNVKLPNHVQYQIVSNPEIVTSYGLTITDIPRLHNNDLKNSVKVRIDNTSEDIHIIVCDKEHDRCFFETEPMYVADILINKAAP